MNLVKTSLKYSQVTLTILGIVFIAGIYLLFTMPRREDAKISIRQGMIYAFYPGANASQVEQRVTKKLEEYLFRFDEVNKSTTYSTSKDGVCIINVDLMEEVEHEDIFWNKIRHELMIAKSMDLPSEMIGPVVNANFGDVEALLISVESNEVNYPQLLNYAKLIEANLRTIAATSKIKRIGEQKEQITVTAKNDKLAQYGLDITQVIKILQSQNKNVSAGNLENGNKKIAFHTSGNYNSQQSLENQIVGTSQQGAVIRLKDIADIQRENSEVSSSVSVNGKKAIVLAVENLDGNNIVDFGKAVDQHLAQLKQQIPSSVSITTIVNQPQVVQKNVNSFLFEFFGALIAVTLVVMLLLPFRIALVSAMAIPMTVALTIVLMKAFDIQLQQVSLASLIVVLGMIVDDAIVIADNYVELLDKGISRAEAAWRSATELVVPILTATVTIIAAFLPMVVISGRVGEFIYALPITVTISLASSFIIAMILTPILCYTFIKKGLHDHTQKEVEKEKKKNSVLDIMQRYHTRMLIWCTVNKKTTITMGIVSILLCYGLVKLIPQKFFPAAERNQFVIDLWMPTGTQYAKTDSAVKHIENILKNDPRIVSYASFTGMSLPRFYYNFSPEFPSTDFAQILINTTTEKTTEELIIALEQKVNTIVPEGIPFVRQMQQGNVLKAPVEVRVYGDDITQLKKIGGQIDSIIRTIPGHGLLRSSLGEDFYTIHLKLKDEAAQLGFTNEAIAQNIYAGFTGAPITTLYENDNEINVVFQLNKQDRNDVEQLKNMYLTSPATGKKIPLRQIADIAPEWRTGKIMHRNGVRILTVECNPDRNVFASDVLKKIQPQIAALSLPIGYTIEYGGELEGKRFASTQLVTALLIGILLIFIILLIEFHTLKKVFIVMSAIPLSMFGALIGLWITKSNMGFTAFISLISLSGIVVRNAIILVDYADELVAKGVRIERAAIEAAQRRLRPIFLTSTAAAIGVIPMLLSGSQLWEPMAACLSFGILWSMLTALLILPVIYIVLMKKKNIMPKKHFPQITILFILCSVGIQKINAQEKPLLSLNKAVEATLANNRLIKIKSYQTQEKQAKWKEDKVRYYPAVNVNAGYMYNANLASLNIAPGTFGTLPLPTANIPLPSTPFDMNLTEHNMYAAGISLYQPLTQQGKINAAVGRSFTETHIAKVEQQKVTSQILQAVEKLYGGLLLAKATMQEKYIYYKTSEQKLQDALSALDAGKILEVNILGLQAQEASNEQEYLKASIEVENYTNDLSSLTGLPIQNYQLDTLFFTQDILLPDSSHIEQNYDMKLAVLSQQKINYALNASKWNNVPDIGVFAGYTYMGGTSLFPKNSPVAGVAFKWNLQDLFSIHKTTTQRKLQLQQANENKQQIEEDTRYSIQKAYRKINQYNQLKKVAQKSLEYNKKMFLLEQNASTAGYKTTTQQLENEAKLKKAENDWLSACIGYRLAVSELKLLLGKAE